MTFAKLFSLLLVGVCGCGNSATATFNNCTSFKDHSAANDSRVITFGGTVGLNYSPACMEIAAGQSVDFKGAFGTHPLTAGTGPTGLKDGSAGNPITTPPATATDTSFAFPTAGLYPFFCQNHVGSGMAGVVKVH